MAKAVYLAVDLGASSGRHVAGLFDGGRLELADVHRFENGPVPTNDHLYWDVLGLWSQVRLGLRAAAGKYGDTIASVGVDTWGVDFGLLGRGDELLGNPYNYRDSRTDGMLERAFEHVPRDEIFAQTGLQFMQINTLFQLLAMHAGNSPILEQAESLLMMPDLFHWLLTGVKSNEMTIASTTQCYDPRKKQWAKGLLARLEIPSQIFGTIAQPGTRLGPLRKEVASETGLTETQVVLPGSHDTASAVMAVPAAGSPSMKPKWCYISSGTWSLMGVELPEPLINHRVAAYNFTNEGGVGGTIRFLKNIVGLWLVQECRRIWNQAGSKYSWDDLNRLAAAAPSRVSFINPDDSSFLAPPDMPEAIRAFCRRTGQAVPADEGAVIRCAQESLALVYRRVLESLEELTGGRIETIHIVGGGTQNRQLCQATADACRRRVVAGPIEATAIGNIMLQAVTAGHVGSISQARQLVRESFSVDQYEPQNGDPWEEAHTRFKNLVA